MGRRPLERVLAILGQVEAAGSQGGTPGHCKGGNGVLALWRVTGAMSLTRGQGGESLLEARESSATHVRSSLSNVTLFPLSPAPALRLAASSPHTVAQAPISPTSPQEGGGGGCGRSQPRESGTGHDHPRPHQRLSRPQDPTG